MQFKKRNYKNFSLDKFTRSSNLQKPSTIKDDDAPTSFSIPLYDIVEEMVSNMKKTTSPLDLLDMVDTANRRLYLNGDVDEGVVDLGRFILYWNKEDEEKNIPVEQRQPIRIYINSCGGVVHAGYALISYIKISKTPVYTYDIGICHSMGLEILLAGHKRFAYPMAQCLIHEGSVSELSGTAEQIQDFAQSYKEDLKVSRDWILSRTKISLALYNKKKSKDWYIKTAEMVELGIVDEIVEDINKCF